MSFGNRKTLAAALAAALVVTGPGGFVASALAGTVVAPVKAVAPVAGNLGLAGGFVSPLNAGAGFNNPVLPAQAGLSTVLPAVEGLAPSVNPAVLPGPAKAAASAVAFGGPVAVATLKPTALPDRAVKIAPAGRFVAAASIAGRIAESPGMDAIRKDGAGQWDKVAALGRIFDGSRQGNAQLNADIEFAGTESAVRFVGLNRFSGDPRKGPASVEGPGKTPAEDAAGSDLVAPFMFAAGAMTLPMFRPMGAVVAIAVAAAAIVSPTFRNHLKRMGQVMLGWIGIGIRKVETPGVLAQRIMDQLEAAKPVFNRKVAEAGTLVEKLRLQVKKEKAKHAELERTITALLSDENEENDVLAAAMVKQQKILEESIAATQEQLGLAEKTLEGIKQDRVRFYLEKEKALAEINAMLARSKRSELQKKMAELRGGFDVDDVKGNMDRLRDAVDEREAQAKGSAESAESDPEEMVRKAKDSLLDDEVKAELARRKAGLKKKEASP